MASRAIRLHPFWRTLPDPAVMAEAGRLLRIKGRCGLVDADPPFECRQSGTRFLGGLFTSTAFAVVQTAVYSRKQLVAFD